MPNRQLIAILTGVLIAAIFCIILVAGITGEWGAPGGPLLQSAAALGALLLIGSFFAVLAKRRGKPGKAGFHGHVWLASIGTGLVAIHGASGLAKPPALLLALLAVLIGLGVWSRLQGARMMAQTFGQKRAAFSRPDKALRSKLQALLEQKQALLTKLDPAANEALFSPTMRHWRRAPILTFRYAQLAAEERRLIAPDQALPPIQARWRLIHRLAGLAFLGGLIGHILIVMFFAGYASDGREIYWLHFAAWDF